MRHLTAVTALALFTSGCAYDMAAPLETRNIVTRGTEPVYQVREDGKILATACLTGKPSGYGPVPSACAVDSAFASQVVNPHDLVHPRQAGASYAARPARVAYEYIYGTPQAADGNAGPQPGVLIPVAPGAVDDEAAAE
jgi:hypothetical protein